MALDDEHERPDGVHAVTNYDLRILSLQIGAKIDSVAASISAMQIVQTEYRTKVDTNTTEIDKLRAHYHDIANRVTAVDLRTNAVTPHLIAEITALTPTLRRGAEIMTKRGVEDLPTPEDLVYLRHARSLYEKNEELGTQITIGQRIQYVAFLAGALLIVISVVLNHIWH